MGYDRPWEEIVAAVDASFKRVEAAWAAKRTSDPNSNGSSKGQTPVDFETLFADDGDGDDAD